MKRDDPKQYRIINIEFFLPIPYFSLQGSVGAKEPRTRSGPDPFPARERRRTGDGEAK